MNYVILEKSRPHKYIKRTGMPGKYEYFYQELKKPEIKIETAPEGLEDINKRRKEAKERIEEWRKGKDKFGTESHPMTDEQIIIEGYQWRQWAHERGDAWSWAVWEEIQKLADEKGYKYKDKLTKEELLDNPTLPDIDKLVEGFSSTADEETTAWRNHSNKYKMGRFIDSDPGRYWSISSKRELWRQIKLLSEKEIEDSYPGLKGLKDARDWNEALNTEIEIYRGIPEEKEEPYRNEKFLSYTVVPAMADKFARGYYHSYDKKERAL